MKNEEISVSLPDKDQLEAELKRVRYRRRCTRTLRNAVFTLITVAAVVVLIATLWMPVLRIYGGSMTPSLHDGNIVLSVKGSAFHTGDVIAFYHNNKILVKRIIAGPSDWVDMDKDGTLYVNGQKQEEPYVSEKTLGQCDIVFPFQVPEERFFVLGDHRAVSVDSRSSAVGCVAAEDVVGKIVCCVWPVNEMKSLDVGSEINE